MVLAKDFFWMKEEGNAVGKKTGIEALATALSLAAKDGSGWETLSELVSDETAMPYPDRPNTVCSPAGPDFKAEELEKLANATKTDIGDWGFTAQDNIEVQATAQPNAPVIDKLGMIFVRVMPDTAPNASQEFIRIVDPGRQGRLCAGRGDQPPRLRPALLRQGRHRHLEDRRHDRRRIAGRGQALRAGNTARPRLFP